jgi:hypothetical protein
LPMTTLEVQITTTEISNSPKNSEQLRTNFGSHHYGYGSGRRMCPGIHLAERTQWRIAAKLLWAFEILPGVDPTTGKPVKLDPDHYNEGLLHGPASFKCIFKPRSQAHADLISRELASARKFLAPYE